MTINGLKGIPVPIVLVGGPRDGFRGEAGLPLPELATLAFCAQCRSEHLVDAPQDALGDRYLRAHGELRHGRIVYRHLDVTAGLRQLLADEQLAPA